MYVLSLHKYELSTQSSAEAYFRSPLYQWMLKPRCLEKYASICPTNFILCIVMNNTLAVISQSGQSLSFFDLTTGARTGYLTDLTAEPHELCYDAMRGLLYVSHAYAHGHYWEHGEYATLVTVVDCEQKRIVDTIDVSPGKGTHGLVIDEKRDILYASVEAGLSDPPGSGGIVGIDLKHRKVVKSIGSEWTSHWFVMTPDGKKAYTCNKEADFISIIDLDGEKMIRKIEVPGGCEQPAISKSGRWVYFPTPGPPSNDMKMLSNPAVQVIDTNSDQIVKEIPVDLGISATHVDSEDRVLLGQYRFDTSSGAQKMVPLNGQLSILSSGMENHRKLGAVEVGKLPLTLLSSSDGKRAFAANIFAGTVTVVDLQLMRVERTIEVDTVRRTDKKYHQGAHGLALVP